MREASNSIQIRHDVKNTKKIRASIKAAINLVKESRDKDNTWYVECSSPHWCKSFNGREEMDRFTHFLERYDIPYGLYNKGIVVLEVGNYKSNRLS